MNPIALCKPGHRAGGTAPQAQRHAEQGSRSDIDDQVSFPAGTLLLNMGITWTARWVVKYCNNRSLGYIQSA